MERVDDCHVLYCNNASLGTGSCIHEYYYYTIELVKKAIKGVNSTENKLKINIILTSVSSPIEHYDFNNENKTVRFFFNEEHTIASRGNNSYNYDALPDSKIINPKNNDYYKSLLSSPHLIDKSDIIINYSVVNKVNIKTTSNYRDVYIKCVLIHPLLYTYYNKKEDRDNHCITTFLYPQCSQKRIEFLNKMREHNINHKNINTCVTSDDFINLYKNTKILINIRQIYEHHTIEELRILPALMCGVIVICEDGPLKEFIPYKDYIIWTSNDDMIKTIRYVEENYNEIHDSFFLGNRLSNLFEIMEEMNYSELYSKLHEFI